MVENLMSFFKPRLIVIYLYILFSFIAKPPIMPEIYVTYSLYLLIGYAMFVIIKDRMLCWSNYLTWSLSIMLLCFISILYAHHKEAAFNSMYTLLIPIVLAFSFIQLISSKEDIKNIFIVLAFSGGLLYVLMMKHDLFNITERLGQEFMGNANAFASFILLSLMAAICSIYQSKSKLLWFVMIIIIIIDYHMLLMSEGRKYLIAPILFTLILSFKACDFKLNKLVITLGLIGVFIPIIVGILINADLISDNLIRRIEMTGMLLQGQTGMMGAGDIERQNMITSGLRYFSNSPIWGNGQCNFSYLFSLENVGGHIGHFSHNNYVELLCNLGIIGFIVYYRFYYKIMRMALRTNTQEANIVFSFFVIILILEFGIVSYYTQFLLQIIVCVVSLNIYNRKKINI